MELNDIKKILYKHKPVAELVNVSKDGIRYESTINDGDISVNVYFLIPFADLGDARFTQAEDAKLLIRWIDSFIAD